MIDSNQLQAMASMALRARLSSPEPAAAPNSPAATVDTPADTPSQTAAYASGPAQAAQAEPMMLNVAAVGLLQAMASAAASSSSFADNVDGTDPKPIDHTFAAFSQAVYGNGAPLPEGWRVATEDDLNNVGLTDEKLQEMGLERTPEGYIVDPESGLQAAVYIDQDGNHVLAFAGSEFSRAALGTDWTQGNLAQAEGMVGPQYEKAMNLGIALQQGLQANGHDGSLVITGHSLGGGLASAVSVATGAPAVTFNASGLHPNTIHAALDKREAGLGEQLSYDEAVAEANGGNIRRYNVAGEILTTAQEDLREEMFIATAIAAGISPATARALFHLQRMQHPALGAEVELEQAIPGMGASQVRNPIDLHMMEAVTAGLDEKVPEIVSSQPQADGSVLMTVRYPHSASSDEWVTMRFGSAREAEAFEESFAITGEPPPPEATVVGTRQVTQYSNRDDDFARQLEAIGISGPQMQHYTNDLYADGSTLSVERRADGTVASATMNLTSTDGTDVVVSMAFDAEGNEIVSQRRYDYTVTPANANEAALLNMALYGTVDGPIVPGESYTIRMDQADMEATSGTLLSEQTQGTASSGEQPLAAGTGTGLDDTMVVATNLGASRQPHDNGFIASLFALWRPGESDAGAANAAPPDENGVIELNVAGD